MARHHKLSNLHFHQRGRPLSCTRGFHQESDYCCLFVLRMRDNHAFFLRRKIYPSSINVIDIFLSAERPREKKSHGLPTCTVTKISLEPINQDTETRPSCSSHNSFCQHVNAFFYPHQNRPAAVSSMNFPAHFYSWFMNQHSILHRKASHSTPAANRETHGDPI